MDVFDFLRAVNRIERGGAPVTVYSLSNHMGISRYKVRRLADVAVKRGLCYCSSEKHRPGVRKNIYTLTSQGDLALAYVLFPSPF